MKKIESLFGKPYKTKNGETIKMHTIKGNKATITRKEESLLFTRKSKHYLKPGEKPPEGVQVKTGSRGGKYIEDEPEDASSEFEKWQAANEEKIIDDFISSDKVYQAFEDYAAGVMDLTKDNFEEWAQGLELKDIPRDFVKDMYKKKEPVSKGEKDISKAKKLLSQDIKDMLKNPDFAGFTQKDIEDFVNKYELSSDRVVNLIRQTAGSGTFRSI